MACRPRQRQCQDRGPERPAAGGRAAARVPTEREDAAALQGPGMALRCQHPAGTITPGQRHRRARPRWSCPVGMVRWQGQCGHASGPHDRPRHGHRRYGRRRSAQTGDDRLRVAVVGRWKRPTPHRIVGHEPSTEQVTNAVKLQGPEGRGALGGSSKKAGVGEYRRLRHSRTSASRATGRCRRLPRRSQRRQPGSCRVAADASTGKVRSPGPRLDPGC
jgi:hypothetical protein